MWLPILFIAKRKFFCKGPEMILLTIYIKEWIDKDGAGILFKNADSVEIPGWSIKIKKPSALCSGRLFKLFYTLELLQ